jgi:hypothetical protein
MHRTNGQARFLHQIKHILPDFGAGTAVRRPVRAGARTLFHISAGHGILYQIAPGFKRKYGTEGLPMEDIQQIRAELERMKQDLAKEAPVKRSEDSQIRRCRRPCLDFGLFLLSFFFWLIVIVTAELSAGIAIHRFTVFAALPCAWLTIALLRRAPLYALLVAAAGAAALAVAAYGVSLFYDTALNSNSYFKPITGMLMNGWNPFRQTFIDFANAHTVLPYNDGWLSYQLGSQPKAPFMIGAAFYALTGSIESGKLFNLISLIACVCIAAPMLKDAFNVNRAAAFLVVLLACVNPVTLAQLGLYYYDGFAYQTLTIAAVSFAYVLFKPNGALAGEAKAAAFVAVCIAANVSSIALLFAVILSTVYCIARAVQIRTSEDAGERLRPTLGLLAYCAAMAVCAVLVLGASTYVVNFLRYGNPLHGMLGQSAINSLPANLTSPVINALPLIAQFFVSMFSPMSGEAFTQISLKLPFTITREEWSLSTLGANVSGWGILFGGIFLLSVLIVLITAIRMFRRSPRAFWLLLGTLLIAILPAAFVLNLYSARDNLLPYWAPLAALVCLFMPAEPTEQTHALKNAIVCTLKAVFAAILCVLLIVNAYTGITYLRSQASQTVADRAKIADVKDRIAQGDTEFDVTTIARGQFYGLLFNLQDAGIDYRFSQSLPMIQNDLLYYMVYAFRALGPQQDAQAEAFLNALYSDGYLVVIAANGGSPLPERMAALLQNIGLMLGGPADPAEGYLAVIDPDGNVLVEQTGYLTYKDVIEEVDLLAESAEGDVSVVIGGTEYGDDQSGFHIVVYDTKNLLPVYSVRIDPGADPVMTSYPVRIPIENN